MSKLLVRLITAAAILLALPALVHAADAFPSRPIRLIVGYVPGGGPDTLARTIAQKLMEVLGQPVVVENRPGAGGQLSTDLAVHAPADGYTLLLGETGQLEIAPYITRNLRYDALRDLTPLGMLATVPLTVVTSPQSHITSFEGLLKEATARPGKLDYGSSGIGTIHHITAEVMMARANVSMNHVPYRGSGASIPALLGGEIPVLMTSLPFALPMVKAGSVNLIAVTSAKRLPEFPNVPAVSEYIKGFEFESEMGILAPAGIPADVAHKLSAALKQVVTDPAVKQKMLANNLFPVWLPAHAYGERIRENLKKYESAVKLARIDPQ